MNIKVLCPCGAKFRFEIEPVNGRMPGSVACPTCGGDATELANIVISQQLSGAQPVATIMMASTPAAPQPIMPPPAPTARVAAPVAAAPPSYEAPSAPSGAMCPKHRTE